MSNTSCLTGIPFALTGAASFEGSQVNFEVTFDSSADEAQVIAYQWYLNDVLVPAFRTKEFQANLPIEEYSVGVRILTAEGWSGVKRHIFEVAAEVIEVNIAWSNVESASPYIDSNLIIRVNGNEIEHEFSNRSDSFIVEAGQVIQAVFFGDAVNPWPPHSSATLRVLKNGILLKEKTTSTWVEGESESISFTAEAGSSYEIKAFTFSTAAEVNIAWSNTESDVNSNLRIIINGTPQEFYITDSGTITAHEGDTVIAEAFAEDSLPWPANSSGTLQVLKDGSLIYNHTVTTWNSGVLDSFPFTLEAGSSYEVRAFTNAVTQVNIAYSNYEVNIPEIINSNLIIRKTGSEVPQLLNGAGNMTANAGDTITAVFAGEDVYPWPSHNRSLGFLEVFKDGSLLNSKTIFTWGLGDLDTITFTAEAGASYEIKAYTLLMRIEGPLQVLEGEDATYQVLGTHFNGSTIDLTHQYTFAAAEGSFNGATLTLPHNGAYDDDDRELFIEATWGASVLTLKVSVTDTSIGHRTGLDIVGPEFIAEGDSATYTVMETFNSGQVVDITSQFQFSCTEGTFVGATLTIETNNIPNEADRPATITASNSVESHTLNITITDPPVISENPVDYLLIKFSWGGGFANLNPLVGFEYNNNSYDYQYVGTTYGAQVPMAANANDAYLLWAGVTSLDSEQFVINMKSYLEDNIEGSNLVYFGLFAYWEQINNEGNFTIEISAYSGGELIREANEFRIEGGTSRGLRNIPTNTQFLGTNMSASSADKVATLTYNKATGDFI